MKNKQLLISNLNKIHTTEMGIGRIKKNLNLQTDDVVLWCKTKIKDKSSSVTKKGKNYYIYIDDCIITINSYSYTIITAHKIII